MADLFVNKVADSGIITINLEDYYLKESLVSFDLKDYLFMGLILKEKDFRAALKELHLEAYANKIVAVHCSADAVIPMWAYMLVASTLQPLAAQIIFGDEATAKKKILLDKISAIDPAIYTDKKIVIKGCGDLPMPEEAYMEITKLLRPVASSIMYGEPCSTVPVFKKQKITSEAVSAKSEG